MWEAIGSTLVWFTAVAFAYLVGSIPFGLLLGKLAGTDIRLHGSGNIGATNVARVLGRKWGGLCFALDFLKGAIPVVVGGKWLIHTFNNWSPDALQVWAWLAVAVAPIVGHMFPIWLKGKGGKGVATGFGALLAMYPFTTIPAILALIAWIVTLRLSRYVSLASCAAALTMPLGVLIMCLVRAFNRREDETFAAAFAVPLPFLLVTLVLAAVVIFKHRTNLSRINQGTEHRVGDKPKDHDDTTDAAPARHDDTTDQPPPATRSTEGIEVIDDIPLPPADDDERRPTKP